MNVLGVRGWTRFWGGVGWGVGVDTCVRRIKNVHGDFRGVEDMDWSQAGGQRRGLKPGGWTETWTEARRVDRDVDWSQAGGQRRGLKPGGWTETWTEARRVDRDMDWSQAGGQRRGLKPGGWTETWTEARRVDRDVDWSQAGGQRRGLKPGGWTETWTEARRVDRDVDWSQAGGQRRGLKPGGWTETWTEARRVDRDVDWSQAGGQRRGLKPGGWTETWTEARRVDRDVTNWRRSDETSTRRTMLRKKHYQAMSDGSDLSGALLWQYAHVYVSISHCLVSDGDPTCAILIRHGDPIANGNSILHWPQLIVTSVYSRTSVRHYLNMWPSDIARKHQPAASSYTA